MTELDKFKRRTIRSVARLMRQKKPPDELWKEMKKETGTNCRVLWERMRVLCAKKLNRMLAVDDRSDTLPSIARLSLTDWLLVDLVLVHEKIDVIATNKVNNKAAEQKPLIELFNMVQRFDVEGRDGEPLAEAWAAATVFYNRQGRQCSPMLLQRRWYQLKKLTRCQFYKFWQSYRGNTRLLVEAKEAMPTRLQMAVAKRYPSVITGPFPEWEELIEKRLVILPEEFESKMRMTNLPKPCNSNDPDLVVVEPVIETIDLGVDSDAEEPREDNLEDTSDPEVSPTEDQALAKSDLLGVKIKTEPAEEDGLSNVQVVATTHITEVELRDSPERDADPPSNTVNEQTYLVDNEIENSPDYEDDVIEIPKDIPTFNIDMESPNKNIAEMEGESTEETVSKICSVSSNIVSINQSDNIVDDIIKIKADEFCRKDFEITNFSSAVDDLIKDKVNRFLDTPKEKITLDDKKPEVSAIDLINEKHNLIAIDLMADLNFIDDGIEFVDDGVEFVEEDNNTNKEPNIKSPPVQHSNEDSDSNNKFDLKLLMDPVVYTTKLDHMNIFIDKSFDTVSSKADLDKIVAESKPESKKSFKINIEQEVKTAQSQNAGLIQDIGVDDDLFTNKEESDDEQITKDVTVSINSNLLKKPSSRSYNPIQLCKNPDFNTKLRRLTIGFLSSMRNRQFLNACIPMTIDVSKSFESKLVDGTLYLKSSGTDSNIVKKKVVDNQTSSVMPSAMPVQSLIDNSKTNINDFILTQSTEVTPGPVVSERKKIINLPDIDKVRKINQQLLTAQVPPIRVYAGDRPPAPTVTAIVTNQAEDIKQPEPHLLPTQALPSITPPDPGMVPTLVKVESEVNFDSKSVLPGADIPAETLPPAKKKLLKMINQATILTQEALTKIDVGDKSPVSEDQKLVSLLRKVTVKPNEPTRKHTFKRVRVPWEPKFVNRSEQIDDALITDDTLNKMLHLMGGDNSGKECGCLSKNKKTEVKKGYQQKKKKTKDDTNTLAKREKTTPVQDNKATITSEDEAANKNIPPSNNKDQKPVLARGRVFRYCCWARQKICNRKRITKHMCPPDDCSCCCRDELVKTLEKNTIKPHTAIVVSDDEDSLKRACESIETVVQQSRELTLVNYRLQETTPIPVVRTVSTSTSTDMEHENNGLEGLTQGALNAPPNQILDQGQRLQPPVIITKVIEENQVIPSPVIITKVIEENKVIPPPVIITKVIERNQVIPKMKRSLMPKQVNDEQQSARFIPKIKSIPTPKPVGEEQQSARFMKCVPCSCQKLAVTQGSQRNIVIDASRKCPAHTVRPQSIAPKNEKILYLHSKTISKSPSESPIFLGKNKILLTTVKFPRKDEPGLPECVVSQKPKIIPTLPLPTGVQLVLLPSGCVTYTLDQGTELSEAQLATLPTIIAAVQDQLKSNPVPTPISPISNINFVSSEPVVNVCGEVTANTEIPVLPAAVSLVTKEMILDAEMPLNVKQNLEVDTPVAPITTIDTPVVTIKTSDTPIKSIETIDTPIAPITTIDTPITSRKTIDTPLAPITTIDIPVAPITTIDTPVAPLTTVDTPVVPITTIESPVPPIMTIETLVAPITTIETQLTGIPSLTENESTPSTKESVNVRNEKEAENDISPLSNDCPSVLNDSESVVESEIQTEKQIQETQSIVKDNEGLKESNEATNNRKTLLSDLMEMSGISAEDTTAAEPPAATEALTEGQGPNIANMFLNADQARNLPELSPVTSLTELKYACEQNGMFFKLDFETGFIVPINVCIKKNPKKTVLAHPKAIIDLTDDIDESNDEMVTKPSELVQESNISTSNATLPYPAQYVYKGQTLNVASTIKPIKLFKAVRPPLLKRKTVVDVENITPARKRTHLENRKQDLNKVEAKIDLVDSDAPMEEEYLMDSSDNESLKISESMTVESLDLENLDGSDYSSDDEPLAKKSKRLKETNVVTEDTDSVLESNISLAINFLDEDMLDSDPKPKEVAGDETKDMASDSEESPGDGDNEDSNKDAPLLRFMSDPSDNEGGEEDCILGV